jgi:hypothetical protein
LVVRYDLARLLNIYLVFRYFDLFRFLNIYLVLRYFDLVQLRKIYLIPRRVFALTSQPYISEIPNRWSRKTTSPVGSLVKTRASARAH